MKRTELLLLTLVFPVAFSAVAQCNLHNSLCSKRYNEVAYLTTHNAYNSTENGFTLPNHNYNITSQLNFGVRGLMIDVYYNAGINLVYHGFPFLGTEPLTDVLTEIRLFLDANPNEIVTIILECYVSSNAYEQDMITSGLLPYVYTHTGGQWPTLQEMINANERLVILSDADDAAPGQEWYHYVWDYAVETHYSVYSSDGFTCDFNRGDSINDLFILNHFITDQTLGVGWEDSALIANSNPFFTLRAQTCQQLKQKFPNFPTVDFYEVGDALQVVDILNGITPLNTNVIEYSDPLFGPNPVKDKLILRGSGESVTLYDMMGNKVEPNSQSVTPNVVVIDVSNVSPGVYILEVNNRRSPFIKL